MQNFFMKMLDEKIPNLWSLMVQEYHILGFEGMIITLMVLAGEGLMKKFARQKILLKVHQAVPTKDRHGIFWMAGFATLTLLSSISFAQSNPPAPGPPSVPLMLTLRQAIDTALENNTQVQLTEEETHATKARSHEALAILLPNISGQYSQANTTVNLKARGLDFSKVPLPGFTSLSTLVGPFNTFDARAYLQQTLFNFSAIRQYQAARINNKVATLEADRARRDTIALVASLYYGVLQSQARIEATQANIRLNESLLELAEHQKEAGTGTAVDVTRAKVQLAQQRQRLLSDQVAYEDARLKLLKAMGKDVGIEITLVDTLALRETPVLTVAEALATANQNRVELQSQAERQRAVEMQLSAVRGERLPSISFVADYGSSGLTPSDSALATRTYGVAATVPVFDGGRREARIAEQSVRARQEAVRTNDLKQQVEVDVRLALKTLESARQQVSVAEENLKLAETELELSRDRFQEGVTNNIEVVNAQTSLEQARDRRVDALYLFNLARVNLDRALGQVERIYQ